MGSGETEFSPRLLFLFSYLCLSLGRLSLAAKSLNRSDMGSGETEFSPRLVFSCSPVSSELRAAVVRSTSLNRSDMGSGETKFSPRLLFSCSPVSLSLRRLSWHVALGTSEPPLRSCGHPRGLPGIAEERVL